MKYQKHIPISILFFFIIVLQFIGHRAIAQDINLGLQYFKDKKYEKAAIEFEAALPQIKKDLGDKDTTIYSTVLFFTAKSYHKIKNIEKAKKYYLECIAVYENSGAVKNKEYAIANNNLASIYNNLGNYKKAEQYYTLAFQLNEELFGKNHPNYAANCYSMADFYMKTGAYNKAEALLITAERIFKDTIGKNNLTYAKTIEILAVLYLNMANSSQYLNKRAEYLYKSELNFLKAKNIIKKLNGTDKRAYTNVCNNLAGLYVVIGDYVAKPEEKLVAYRKAVLLYTETNNIIKNQSRRNNVSYALSCAGVGIVYKKMIPLSYAKQSKDSLLKNAELQFLESEEIIEKIYGKHHPLYVTACSNLAGLYTSVGKYKDAEPYWLRANTALNYRFKQSAKFMSEKQRETYFNTKLIYKYDLFNSFFISQISNNEQLASVVYNNALYLKGQLLKSSISIRKAILQTNDSLLIQKYNKMNEYGKLLAQQYSLPIEKRRLDIQKIEENANILEKELVALAQNYINRTNEDIKYTDIQKSLKKDEIAIEFVNIRYHNGVNWTDSTFYYALILRKDYTYPKAVFLFEEKQLQSLLERQENENDFMYVKRLYSPKSMQSDSLYALIFKPIEVHLKNTKLIHLSPTGLLNKIAFDALVSDTSGILSDKYSIFYSSTTAEAVNKTGLYPTDIEKVVLFGGIEYDLTPDQMSVNAKTIKQELQTGNKKSIDNTIDRLSRNVSWAYLEGSKLETEKIDRLVADKNIAVQLYSGKQGSEEQFKALENAAPSVIHVSTHGFYFGNDKKSKEYIAMIDDKVKFAHSENPLLRSGFILAGGNAAFQGKTIPDGVEDGVLTAAEISQMNLFNTKLVVLSACQTGLGDVKGNEGVYGLQRAFKMAGVEYLLFSLWEVPDYQTRELMSDFYENWFSGMEVRAAFKKAQNQLKVKYAKVEGSAFAWAAFVLMK